MHLAEDRQETYRWAVLAAHLNGAADSAKYEHIDVGAVVQQLKRRDLWPYLRRELGQDVAYALDKMTEAQLQRLTQHCQLMAMAYEPQQFHVSRSGLALVVGFLLHLIANVHTDIPT